MAVRWSVYRKSSGRDFGGVTSRLMSQPPNRVVTRPVNGFQGIRGLTDLTIIAIFAAIAEISGTIVLPFIAASSETL
jgi:hypothetical protein